MIVKMLNTHAHGVFSHDGVGTFVRRWCLSGREGFVVLSPSRASLRARDSGVFREMKCLFSIASEVVKVVKALRCFMS
jgi:hypothetical protein